MSSHTENCRNKITIPSLVARKKKSEKIVMLTAYDYHFGRILEQAGVDIILVGDSLANVILGHENTLSVTLDDMIYHTRAVSSAVKSIPVIGDMPFLSYGVTVEETILNAGRFLSEGHASGVKIEGCSPAKLDAIYQMINLGIPVMGHLGLTPQSVNVFGGYRAQAKTPADGATLIKQALELERAGVFSIVLENIPDEVASAATEALSIPTIGIGAGSACDGQVLVIHDLIGLSGDYIPPFARRYADLESEISKSVKMFCEDVRNRKFPSDKETVKMLDEHRAEFQKNLDMLDLEKER